jgi:VWFA-related protein
LLALVTGVSIAAQQSGVTSNHLFRSAVDLVTLHLTVTDGSGGYVTNLSERDIAIYEDGRPQQVRLFQEGGLPLAVMLLLDTSSSMGSVFPQVQQAAVEFLRQLEPRDMASVVTFGDTMQVRQPFTTDHAALEQAVVEARAWGSTRLYTALYVALKKLGPEIAAADPVTPRRSATIVLSDGTDTASVLPFDDVLALATRADTAVYAIRMGRSVANLEETEEAEFVLRQLATQTGGRAFLGMRPEELRLVYDDIRAELAGQYALGFVSTNVQKDGAFRRLAVQILRANAYARARRGYFAPGTEPR